MHTDGSNQILKISSKKHVLLFMHTTHYELRVKAKIEFPSTQMYENCSSDTHDSEFAICHVVRHGNVNSI